ncbi:MCE family protein [Mycolicibacterium sp. YH-1]|uniref:MCE family protein n=1 Tax=Mycolicibacterium sp. YH-1 TaxID=2908837 RepID=UPI001F4C3C25|nr:MCE family protein [Mycolicibacterium sp. YH-1]UNB53614.1 MCE family protein [Mycolicibacterium sp. YH-1]
MAIDRHAPPYKVAGAVFLIVIALVATLIYKQFRGDFDPRTPLVVVSPRAGLVVEPGAKVTLNGVEIGKLKSVTTTTVDGAEGAHLNLEVDSRQLSRIPANVEAHINASTVFGNKYIALSSPGDPSAQRISSGGVIRASSVTTEFNSLFETVTAIAEQVDPIKLNATLTATAEALTGLGDRFGASLEHANVILDDVNARMPRLTEDIVATADLTEIYADSAPGLADGLDAALTTAASLNERRKDVDAALMASIGFATTAAETFEEAAPFLVRGAADLVPSAKLLDDYRGMLFCTIRNYHDVAPRIQRSLGGDNGYSLSAYGTVMGAGNPFIYPDNLPRVNARGGPEGRPGCWQKVTRDLWPHPYLVMDTGYSIAPYNHMEIGQPVAIDYVWGRQIGQLTINP